MPPRLRTAPRKKPSQERSTATVEAVLQATARLLAKDGYDRLSTNKIAAAAGVSVGSLYQYFPSKEALVAALADRQRERMIGIVLERLVAHADAPAEVSTRAAIEALIEAHKRDRPLTRAILEQVPRIGKLKDIVEGVEVQAAGAVRETLGRRAHELRKQNLAMAAWLVSHTVNAAVQASVTGSVPGTEDELVEELVDLVVRYLRP
jgi:AcrR family transcriptional regulator